MSLVKRQVTISSDRKLIWPSKTCVSVHSSTWETPGHPSHCVEDHARTSPVPVFGATPPLMTLQQIKMSCCHPRGPTKQNWNTWPFFSTVIHVHKHLAIQVTERRPCSEAVCFRMWRWYLFLYIYSIYLFPCPVFYACFPSSGQAGGGRQISPTPSSGVSQPAACQLFRSSSIYLALPPMLCQFVVKTSTGNCVSALVLVLNERH